MDATNIILLDGDKSDEGESNHYLIRVHDTDNELMSENDEQTL